MSEYGKYEAHYAANIFPLIEGKEFADMVKDIKENGQRDRIEVLKGTNLIIDGRNRYRACEAAGVTPDMMEIIINDDDSIVSYVMSRNLFRRQLSPEQRAAAAVEALPAYEREAADRKREAGKEAGALGGAVRRGEVKVGTSRAQPSPRAPKARDRAAADFGISGTQVQRAKFVKENDPELFEELKKGSIKVATAERVVKEKRRQPMAKDHFDKAVSATKDAAVTGIAARVVELSTSAAPTDLPSGRNLKKVQRVIRDHLYNLQQARNDLISLSNPELYIDLSDKDLRFWLEQMSSVENSVQLFRERLTGELERRGE